MKRLSPRTRKILAILALAVMLCITLRLLFYARTLATMGPIPY